ncbi:FHA domain-containing protein [Nocardia sp. NPDC019395]|uniref:FHA domain-containing protein n=1 Tax=Nocardia sp. NPDC019395 TaxID=3154686 RepID=UPI0033E29631
MRDQQVEVVPGSHAAARVAGAVVLVAHRGPGRPTENSPAVRALVALVALVYEAAARQPDGPGPAIAQEATRWLMARAERTGPENSVDFGILSAAAPGQVAIFLHGGITAVVAGADTEYFHGRDAVFTVDRAAAVPSRAMALFVDDPPVADGDDSRPELPVARGIGRLVEGIAEAGGVIAWSPSNRHPSPATGTDRAGGVVLGKAVPAADETARNGEDSESPEPDADDRPAAGTDDDRESSSRRPEPGEAVTAAAETPVNSVQLSERETLVSGSDDSGTAGRGGTDGSRPPETDPHRAQTEISGRQRSAAGGDHRPDEGTDETADSRPRHPSVHPTPRTDLPVPQHGPPERATPPMDAELRRRTEDTAKGKALTVKVRGFKCARAHPTDPRSAFCSVCGMPVDQTQPLIEVVRPPLGILVLDDGATYLLESDSVLGRDPEKSEQVRRGLIPLKVSDNSGGMSRAHVDLLLVDWDVTLVDRGSTNGTRTRVAGYREWVRVPPHQPVVLVAGTEILIGNRVVRFESAAPPPFGT